jgi:hypothetical protein
MALKNTSEEITRAWEFHIAQVIPIFPGPLEVPAIFRRRDSIFFSKREGQVGLA